jgi:GGDEF domain-containing protein
MVVAVGRGFAMADFSFRRYLPKFKAIFGVRARLVIVSLVLVVPLLVDRVHILEASRESQVKAASAELASVARRGAQAQREMVRMVEGMLRTSAAIYVHAHQLGRPCALLESGLKVNVRGVGNISVVNKDGRVICSSLPVLVGVDITDRPYFHDALARRQMVLSDYLVGKANGDPLMVAAFPTSIVNKDVEAVVVTSISLTWLEELVGLAPASVGMTITLIDGGGAVLASRPAGDTSSVTRAVIDQVMTSTAEETAGAVSSGSSQDGRLFAAARVPDTNARLIVSINERAMLGPIDRDIRRAYLQLALMTLLVVVGAWFVSERLVIRPIRMLTNAASRLGAGDLTARGLQNRLPYAFTPLVQAFDAMATRLAERERELLNLNSQLSLEASVDALSGLANRRAFDACLTKVGEVLKQVATEVKGFGARYGGEEFSLMLPGADAMRMTEVGEMIRAGIEALDLPHGGAPLGRITVSVGIAAVTPVPSENPLDLVEAADAGLYMAKRRGRNVVVEHGEIRSVDQVMALAG